MGGGKEGREHRAAALRKKRDGRNLLQTTGDHWRLPCTTFRGMWQRSEWRLKGGGGRAKRLGEGATGRLAPLRIVLF